MSAETDTAIDGTYEIRGQGSDLAIAVAGPNRESCLAAAVRGFAAALTDDVAGAPTQTLRIKVDGESDADYLVGLIEEAVWQLDAEGLLAVDVGNLRWSQDALEVTMTVVDVSELTITGVAPKAASWHDLILERADDGWHGHVVIDL